MKLTIQAIICSFIIHVIYFIGLFAFMYIQTKNYQPDFYHSNNVVVLQDEVAFGMIGSPHIHWFTFIGVAIMSGIAISIINKFKSKLT